MLKFMIFGALYCPNLPVAMLELELGLVSSIHIGLILRRMLY